MGMVASMEKDVVEAIADGGGGEGRPAGDGVVDAGDGERRRSSHAMVDGEARHLGIVLTCPLAAGGVDVWGLGCLFGRGVERWLGAQGRERGSKTSRR